jgi:uncharacterized protein YbbC (DUF1343 family)
MMRPLLPVPPTTGPATAIYVLIVLLAVGCQADGKDPASVRTGAEVLAANDFAELEGARVGLIVNHTARVDTAHLIDRVDRASNVELGALFGPEHGLRGTAGAGEAVTDGRDGRTGAPVYSLYDDTRRPTPSELEGIDALVFDVQDVGARFYTYITTMGLAMQAAAEADLRFVVLDRPNPLGGTYVSGFALKPEQQSFVGRYPIPVAHGLTVGELAQFIKGEQLLPGIQELDLTVVSMDGWSREMQWPDTGGEWTAPSPNLPTWETALVYAGMCFFEGVRVNEGRGTDHPFLQVGLPWGEAAAQAVVDTLQARSLPGVSIDTTTVTPTSRPEAAPSPRFEGQTLSGFRLRVTNRRAVQPVELGVHALHAAYRQAEVENDTGFVSRPSHLTRLAGTERLTTLLEQGASPEALIGSWRDEVQSFRDRRTSYLLY